MLITIEGILAGEDLERAQEEALGLSFVDGKATAGSTAKSVKENLQATGPIADALVQFVRKALDANPIFQAAAQIRHYGPIIISLYEPGMAYGLHVDNAFMNTVRSDLSFTLFLSEPDSYDGGELSLELPSGTQSIKLKAGDLVLYPSTSLHQVNAITRGKRLAVVGWIESRVLHSEAREALFDIANVRASLASLPDLDNHVRLTLQKAEANLMRLLSQ